MANCWPCGPILFKVFCADCVNYAQRLLVVQHGGYFLPGSTARKGLYVLSPSFLFSHAVFNIIREKLGEGKRLLFFWLLCRGWGGNACPLITMFPFCRLSRRLVLLQQMESHLRDKDAEQAWHTQEADAAHKRNASLLNVSFCGLEAVSLLQKSLVRLTISLADEF